MAARSSPLACIGVRGITTFSPAAPRKKPYGQQRTGSYSPLDFESDKDPHGQHS
jgi:hypothetical protein